MIKISVLSMMHIFATLERKPCSTTDILIAYYKVFGIVSPKDIVFYQHNTIEDKEKIKEFKTRFGDSTTFEEALQVVISKQFE